MHQVLYLENVENSVKITQPYIWGIPASCSTIKLCKKLQETDQKMR